MPICGRLVRVEKSIDSRKTHFRVYPHPEASQSPPFVDLLQCHFPDWRVQSTRSDSGPCIDLIAPPGLPVLDANRCQHVLEMWQKGVTICDEANESHALYLHSWVIEDGQWEKTNLGKQIDEVRGGGQINSEIYRDQIDNIAHRFSEWITAHPKYAQCQIIAAAPAHNPAKTFQFPPEIAWRVARTLEIEILNLQSTSRTSHQDLNDDALPTIEEVANMTIIPRDLHGHAILLIDDVYRSGRTIEGTTRALRAAGASRIYALVATKTARFCNGLPPHREHWFTGDS